MCKDFRKTTYIICFVLVLVSTSFLIGFYHLVNNLSNGWLLNQNALTVMFKIFAAMFTFCYTVLAVRATSKFMQNRELFCMTNFKLVLLSVILLMPLAYEVDLLNKKGARMEFLLKDDASSCSNLDSPMSYFSRLYAQNYRLLCSIDCPCSGNPMLYKTDKNIKVIEDKSPCEVNAGVRCLYFSYEKELFNAQKCITEVGNSFFNQGMDI
jgi:hypothetical protein